MREILSKLIPGAVLAVLFAGSALAVDLDDDVKPDSAEHISVEASATKSAEVEATYPDEARAVREALDRHIAHAMAHDIDGYLSDFLRERVRYPEVERKYAERAMALPEMRLDVREVYFSRLSRTAATIHTRQISSYLDEQGNRVVHDAIISYRWLKDATDGVWRIAFTERQHTM